MFHTNGNKFNCEIKLIKILFVEQDLSNVARRRCQKQIENEISLSFACNKRRNS